MEEIIREGDVTTFKRCRRAWDLGSRSRRNFEPVVSPRVYDLEKAIHDALALWYFPGMWEWPRAIVLPKAYDGFERSMARQRGAYAARAELTPEQDAAWEADIERGLGLLERYFAWAPGVDAFSPVRVDTDFDANIPDPAGGGMDLVGPRGPIKYKGRIDALVVDAFDAYWIMDHRVVTDWVDEASLLLDERGVAACWAWEIWYYGMRIAGTISNEIRLDAAGSLPAAPAGAGQPGAGQPGAPLAGRRRLYMEATQVPGERVAVTGNDSFRRTRIARSRAELARCGVQMAELAQDMTARDLACYPNPGRHCLACAYRAPCLAMSAGSDAASLLAEEYYDRGPEEVEEGRLGGVTWSMNRGARPPTNFG